MESDKNGHDPEARKRQGAGGGAVAHSAGKYSGETGGESDSPKTTSSRINPGGLSPPHGPVPAPPLIYKMNSSTFSHHSPSRHICSVDLPIPSPTHGQCWRCAASCRIHPLYTHQGSRSPLATGDVAPCPSPYRPAP